MCDRNSGRSDVGVGELMPQTLTKPNLTAPDKALVNVRPQMAKAEMPDNDAVDSLSSVVKEAAKRSHNGKQGAAAAKLGKDDGNFSRDIAAERLTLKDLKALGRSFLAEFGKELVNEYAPLETPEARARQNLREVKRLLDEVEQLLEYVA
jgi:hypothetical protein